MTASAIRPPGWYDRAEGEYESSGLPINSTSLALEASRTVKSGAGTLYGLAGYWSGGSAAFVLIFDANVLPANGAVPVLPFAVPAASNFSVDFGVVGRAFSRGIIVAASTTAATLTLGGASAWFDAQYL